MIIACKRYIFILSILCMILLFCGCSAQTSTENPKPTESTPISTSAPVINAKTPISGTAFTSEMVKRGYEWRGDEVYGNGKHSDDKYKVTEIHDYTLCVAGNNGAYSDVMAIRYIKCVDSTGATNVFSDLMSYSTCNEESGDNYTKVELSDIDGWEYGVVCIVDNTIISIVTDEAYQSTAEQLMIELGY